MTTHTAIPAMLLFLLTACGDKPPGEGKSYVLVHGAFLGASGWSTVADGLRAQGASVSTPDLPAHGADPTPASAATMAAYVDRVAAELADDTILVGHSMAGLVISAAAERHPVRSVVYVGAYRPKSGQSLVDLAMMDAGSELGPHLVFHPDGTVDVDDQFADLFCRECDAAGKVALVSGYRAEPAVPLQMPVTLTGSSTARTTYVHTTTDRIVSPGLQTAMLAASPVDREVSLSTGHVPFVSAPDELVEILLAD